MPADKISKEEWAEMLRETPEDRLYFTDEEISGASGVPVPSLRVLQSVGLITASKAALLQGGYQRVWHVHELIKASVAGALNRCIGLPYRVIGEVSKAFNPVMWDLLAHTSSENVDETDEIGIIDSSDSDTYFDLIDSRYAFLSATTENKAALPKGATRLLIGYISDGWYNPVMIYGLSFDELAEKAGEDVARLNFGFVALAERFYDNYASKQSVNLSKYIKVAARKISGLSVAPVYHGHNFTESSNAKK